MSAKNTGSSTQTTRTRNDKNGDKPRTTTPTKGPMNPSEAPAEQMRRKPKALHETFMDERDDVLGVINELEDQLDRYEETRTKVEHELTETAEKLQKTTQRTQELEWQVVTLQTRLDAAEQLRDEIAMLEEESADANRRCEQFNTQIIDVRKDNAHLTAELKTSNKQLEEYWRTKKERDTLRGDLRTAQGTLQETQQLASELSEDRARLNAQVQEAQITIEDTRSAKERLELDLRAGEDRIREMKHAQETLEDKLENARAEKKNLHAQIAHLDRENHRLGDQRQFYECELTSLRNMNRTTEAALASVKKAFAEVRVALTETKSRTRRRTVDGWPRISPNLAGIMDVPAATLADAETIEETAPTRPATTRTGATETETSVLKNASAPTSELGDETSNVWKSTD